MRTLLPRIVLATTLVGFPAGGAAWAQGGKNAPAAEDPAALLEQASAAYEGRDYPAALAAARRSAELAGRLDAADAALRRVRTLGAADPGWVKMVRGSCPASL